MKNRLIALTALLLLANLFYYCRKAPIETQADLSKAPGTEVQERGGGGPQETVISDLGPAPEEMNSCSPAKVKIVCMQHSCSSLRSNPIEHYNLNIFYHYVDPITNHLMSAGLQLTESNSTVGTWYTLAHPIAQSALLTNPHRMRAEVFDEDTPGNYSIATSNMYVDFDCNTSDGVVTMHNLIPNSGLLSSCTLYPNVAPIVFTRDFTVATNCSNSSTGSQSLTPAQEYLPCSTGGGGEDGH